MSRSYKDISRAWLQIFEKRRKLLNPKKKDSVTDLNSTTTYRYTDYRDFTAKGETLDIWGNFVVPGSDELNCRLFHHYTDKKLYLVTSITEYFFWFIPFTYAEYVIKIPEDQVTHWPQDTYDYFCNFTAQQAIPFIATADKWNINHKMTPAGTDVVFTKNDGSGAIGYDSDYQHMICNELP